MKFLFILLTTIPLLFTASANSSIGFSQYHSTQDIIKSFTQDIVINEDGTLTIEEDIIIYNARRGQIKRGIYRDLKTAPRDQGAHYKNLIKDTTLTASTQQYSIISVLRDGIEIPYKEKTGEKRDHTRIYMGDMNVFLKENKEYSYKFTYKTSPQIEIGKDGDVLDYYIDGGNWDIPIKKVKSIIHTPANIYSFSAHQRKSWFVTHKKDASGLTLITETANKTKSTRHDSPDLSVKVIFQTGFVKHSTWWKIKNKIRATLNKIQALVDKTPLVYQMVIYLLEFMGFIIIYLGIKKKIAPTRDQTKIVVQYYPPENISPALAIFIQQGVSIREEHILTTVYISLARRGLLDISETESTGIFKKKHMQISKLPNDKNIELPLAEEIIYNQMPGSMIVNKSSYGILTAQALKANNALKEEFEDVFYEKENPLAKNLQTLLYYVIPINAILILLLLPSAAIGFIASSIFFIIVVIVTQALLTRRTEIGMEIASHLDGLEKFIRATESNKFKIDPPEMTPEYHNKILPYAIALNCDKEWSDFLKNPINKAMTESRSSSDYMGNRMYSGTGISSAMSTSIESTRPAPTRSGSGSSGGSGGSRGGGGSGGGGGGGF
jgi:uncharacterized membrane protein